MNTLKKIALVILSLHLTLVLVLTVHHVVKSRSPRRSIAVRTTTIRPTPIATSVKPSKPATAKPVAHTSPILKKTAPSSKKTTSSKPTEKKAIPSPIVKRPELTIPSTEIFEEPTLLEPPSLQSSELLVSYLQDALQLPEQGEVVARLVISSSGSLVSCDILQEKSQKNREFLKKRLPELNYPCFNKSTTFTITFRNVENL